LRRQRPAEKPVKRATPSNLNPHNLMAKTINKSPTHPGNAIPTLPSLIGGFVSPELYKVLAGGPASALNTLAKAGAQSYPHIRARHRRRCLHYGWSRCN
jgi:hypothetical protein